MRSSKRCFNNWMLGGTAYSLAHVSSSILLTFILVLKNPIPTLEVRSLGNAERNRPFFGCLFPPVWIWQAVASHLFLQRYVWYSQTGRPVRKSDDLSLR
jgi:hypothetical protein